MADTQAIKQLLMAAHDAMDDYNARCNPEKTVPCCTWCSGEGYDGDGLIHDDSCILVKIRQLNLK